MFQDRPAPGSASTASLATPPHQFILEANKRSLWVTELKHRDPKRSGPLQIKYKKLLSDFPDSTHVKLGPQQLTTLEGTSKAITNLVALHSGEVVEVNPRRTKWLLRRKAPGSDSVDWRSEQWG